MRRFKNTVLYAVTIALAWSSAVAAQQAPAERPDPRLPQPWKTVTDARLTHPDAADWPNYRRTYDATGYSPLKQINAGNVGQLRQVWSYGVPDTAGWVIAPLVVNGVMYIVDGGGRVSALNAATGEVIWVHQRRYPADVAVSQAYNRSRGLTMAGDKIYWGTTDGYLVALDARNGRMAWQTQTGDYHLAFGHDHPGLVADGKVFLGHAGGDYGEPGRFRAYDAQTGKLLWQFNTVPQPGEAGFETWAKETPPRGAAPWATISYDHQSHTVYFGTGQPGPWNQASRGEGDALFSNSIIALDANTGRKKWHFQVIPSENWDRDAVFESVLIDMVVAGRPRKALVQTSKMGWGIVLDRVTGEFISAFKTAFESIITGWTPTGRPIEAPGSTPQKEDLENGTTFNVCPGIFGARNLNAAAFSPQTRLYYSGMNNFCQNLRPVAVEFKPGRVFTGVSGWAGGNGGAMTRAPGLDYVGEFVAFDPASGQRRWAYRLPSGAAMTLSALATAGGIVFGGSVDRQFFALNAASGKLVWGTRLQGDVSGVPITYSVGGRQYIAVPSGGRPLATALGVLTNTPVNQTSGSIWVFALPGPADKKLLSEKRTQPIYTTSSGVEPAAPGAAATPPAAALGNGPFSAAQVGRGGAAFARVCSACHAAEAMTGPAFLAKWTGSTAADVFTRISATMPQNNPGSLSQGEYLDIVSYMLQSVGHATGPGELTADPKVLGSVKIGGAIPR